MMRFRAQVVAAALLFLIAILAGNSLAQAPAAGDSVHPALSFSSYLLSPADRVNAIAASIDGSVFVAGVTLSGVAGVDASRLSAGEGNAFVAKFSPDGSKLVYFTYLGTSGLDEARAIAVDAAGNAYIAGTTRATNFAVVHPLQASCKLDGARACEGTAFVAKVNAAGQVAFATYLGGSGGDEANAIAIDARGNMFVAGSTRSLDFPVSNPVQRFAGGNGDAFVAGISADASRILFATYLGGSDADEARALALDAVGNIYVAGRTSSPDFPNDNAVQSRCARSAQGSCQGAAFVTKLSANGAQIRYSTYLGGSGGDAANAITVDSQGQAYVAGVTRSTDFPATQARQARLRGRSNAFISKLSAQGSALVFSTYFGGSGADQANAIALDPSGNVVVAGWTYSPDFPVQSALQPGCAPAKNGACSFDAFLATLTPDGTQLRFSTYLGGTGSDILRSLSLDQQGSAYLGGWTTSRDFPQAKVPSPPSGMAASASSRKGGSFFAKVSGLSSPQSSVSCGGSTKNWTGGAGDNQWTTAKNWSGSAVPVSTDNVCIASTFTTTIAIGGLATANQTIASLTSGDTLSFNGGPLTVTGNATFSADLAMVGGSLVLNGTTSMTTMHESGGIVSGTGTITLSGLLTWSNGAICTVYSSGVCPAGTNAVVNIHGGLSLTSSFPSLQARTMDIPSGQTVTYTEGSALTLAAAAVVNNAGTWDLSNDGSVFQGNNNDIFNNTGTLKKTTGTSNSYVDPTFNNTGAVSVSATLLMRGSSGCSTPCTGTWTVNTGGSLQFPSGTWTLGTGMTNDSGNAAGILFDGAVMDFANTGTDTFTGPLSLSAGVVEGPATLTFAGLLTWSNGAICTVYSSGVCPAGTNAVVNIHGGLSLTSSFPSLQARTMDIPSGQTVTYTEGSALTLAAAAVVNNAGTWDLSNDGSVFQGNNNDIFNNTGTLKKTTGTSNSYVDPTFNNSGAVLDNGGVTMYFRGTYTQTAGTTELSKGAALQFTNGTATFSGGTFTGNGNVTGNLSNTGANFQGGTDTTTGVIADSGTYKQGASGIFTAKISGSGCTSNDKFTFTGAATLGGPLEIATVNGCAPATGAQFTVMTFASRTGAFSSVTEGWSVTYTATSVVVKYTAGTPGVSLTPTTLAFGTQIIGTTSVAKNVTVKNNGTDGLYINSITITSNYAQGNGCVGIVVNPGSSCTISVTFTPTAENSIPGTLTINDNFGTRSQQVPLSGSGTYLQVTPGSLAFPAQLLKTASSPMTITLKNTNPGGTLTISGITFSGTNAADFSENKACDAAVLAAKGGTCSFTVTFTPSAVGQRTASLNIAENGGASPIIVSLTGSGTYVSLSPSPLAFGSVTVGSSQQLAVTVTNNNPTTTLSVSSATFSGADANDFSAQLGANCSSVAAKGGACNITVTFKPAAKGTRVAVMSVKDTDAGSPQTDNVSGTGQ